MASLTEISIDSLANCGALSLIGDIVIGIEIESDLEGTPPSSHTATKV